MSADVLIVVGGLSGLSLARLLEQQGVDFLLIEARDRLGGRILTHRATHAGKAGDFDLGPAWFWPGQPRMAHMLDLLGLDAFDQYSTGDILSEDQQGQVRRGFGFASMQGSYRISGGFGRLIEKLSAAFPERRLWLNQAARRMTYDNETIVTEIHRPDGTVQSVESRSAVLAMPPRIAAESVQFTAGVPQAALDAMRQIPTWMAGQAKLVALFDRAFWREAGLSGDAMSQLGPMVEIHDASPASGGPYALFGFVGYPADVRLQYREEVMTRARAQLVRLFGDGAASPIDIMMHDWAQEAHTATPLDHAALTEHPIYGLPPALGDLWDGRLVLGSTETAPEFGGYLEGALEAAEIAFERIMGVSR